FPIQLSYPDLQDYAKLNTVFTGIAGFTPSPVNLGSEGRPERAWAELVTGNYFSVLGLEAIRGRTFAPDEGWIPNKDPVVLLSYKFWQSPFGAAPNITAKPVQVNRHTYTVIGVLPHAYHGAYYFLDPDLFIPVSTIGLLSPEQSELLTNR